MTNEKSPVSQNHHSLNEEAATLESSTTVNEGREASVLAPAMNEHVKEGMKEDMKEDTEEHRKEHTAAPVLKVIEDLSQGTWRGMVGLAALAGLPHTRRLWARAAHAMPEALTPLQQELLCHIALHSSVVHPLARHYPRDLRHVLATLQWLEEVFTGRGWSDRALPAHITAIKQLIVTRDPPELAYKSYVFDGYNDKYWHYYDCRYFEELTTTLGISPEEFMNKTLEDMIPHIQQMDNKLISSLSTNGSPSSSVNINKVAEAAVNGWSEGPSHVTLLSPVTPLSHVTLLEAVGGIARGTTGLTSWGGAAVMADWLRTNPQLVYGRRVLELGAGVGYLASALLISCDQIEPPQHQQQLCSQPTNQKELNSYTPETQRKQEIPIPSACSDSVLVNQTKLETRSSKSRPVSYTATDCHPHVLELLHHNLRLMKEEERWDRARLSAYTDEVCARLIREELEAGDTPPKPWQPPTPSLVVRGVPVQVLSLDWRSPELSSVTVADVVIAADIVYAVHLLKPLARLIRLLLSQEGSSSPTRDGASAKHITNSMDDPTSNLEAKNNSLTAPTAFIACTRRSTETISEFLGHLTAEGMSYSVVFQATLDTESALFVYNESHIPVKIYKIVKQG